MHSIENQPNQLINSPLIKGSSRQIVTNPPLRNSYYTGGDPKQDIAIAS